MMVFILILSLESFSPMKSDQELKTLCWARVHILSLASNPSPGAERLCDPGKWLSLSVPHFLSGCQAGIYQYNQQTFIIHAFCLCKCAHLLTFTCHPQINSHGTSAVIHRLHIVAKNLSHLTRFRLRLEKATLCLFVSVPYSMNEYPYQGI